MYKGWRKELMELLRGQGATLKFIGRNLYNIVVIGDVASVQTWLTMKQAYLLYKNNAPLRFAIVLFSQNKDEEIRKKENDFIRLLYKVIYNLRQNEGSFAFLSNLISSVIDESEDVQSNQEPKVNLGIEVIEQLYQKQCYGFSWVFSCEAKQLTLTQQQETSIDYFLGFCSEMAFCEETALILNGDYLKLQKKFKLQQQLNNNLLTELRWLQSLIYYGILRDPIDIGKFLTEGQMKPSYSKLHRNIPNFMSRYSFIDLSQYTFLENSFIYPKLAHEGVAFNQILNPDRDQDVSFIISIDESNGCSSPIAKSIISSLSNYLNKQTYRFRELTRFLLIMSNDDQCSTVYAPFKEILKWQHQKAQSLPADYLQSLAMKMKIYNRNAIIVDGKKYDIDVELTPWDFEALYLEEKLSLPHEFEEDDEDEFDPSDPNSILQRMGQQKQTFKIFPKFEASDFEKNAEDTNDGQSMFSKISQATYYMQVRGVLKQKLEEEAQQTKNHYPPPETQAMSQLTQICINNYENSPIQFQAYINPASPSSQQVFSIIKVALPLKPNICFYMNPEEQIPDDEVIKRWYQPVFSYDLSKQPESVYQINYQIIGTLALHVPDNWLFYSNRSEVDADNINPAMFIQTEITYNLQHLMIEGDCSELRHSQKGEQSFEWYPPKGLEITVQQDLEDQQFKTDTVVMQSGYFQLKAGPGEWKLDLHTGKSNEIYQIVSSNNIELWDFIGDQLFLQVEKREGMENENILGDADQISGITTQGGETIHIFSLASGHLYERLLRIMISSVMNHTSSKVKFWLIENFMSPKMKNFLPKYSKELHFEYELITYKWPWWLQEQTEKQRIIWGYKILFLDVLFPVSVEKIIYIDADQVVRTDIKELWDMDLEGKPYAYTPFCDSNKATEGFRFWKQGYWKDHLGSLNYHISALYVVDLKVLRHYGFADILRWNYEQLSKDKGSLANLDQDLPNYAQSAVPIYSLPIEWLWCETWCSIETLEKAKSIDLCNSPLTKEHKVDIARRTIKEWDNYDQNIARLQEKFAQESLEQTKSTQEVSQESKEEVKGKETKEEEKMKIDL